MSQRKNRSETPQQRPNPEAAEKSPQAQSSAEDAATETQGQPDEAEPAAATEDGAEQVDDPLAALKAESAELRDQLLRALAETENVRNRARREKEEALKYAAAPLARDLLPVADNLRRALDSVPQDLVDADERIRNLVTGIEMTEKALMDAFARHHIAPINPQGEKLDPHRHEAMMEVEDPAKPSGSVAQVFEIGYALRDRLLRPARVSVAKGGPADGNGQSPPGSTVDTEA